MEKIRKEMARLGFNDYECFEEEGGEANISRAHLAF